MDSLRELKKSIDRLKKTKTTLLRSKERDSEQLKGIRLRISRLQTRFGTEAAYLAEKEEALRKYDEIIQQSEQAFHKIGMSTQMLIDTIDLKNGER